MATKILQTEGYNFEIWKNLFNLFYEVLWEYYSPELNKMSLDDIPVVSALHNRARFCRNDLSQFIVEYIVEQVKWGSYEESKGALELLFTMNILKTKMIASTISVNPSTTTIMDKM